ncbi:cytochrome c [Variovorax sp. KK3]|uniref:c-type cytochrome n=1 Tax=Variovorax sp. KK3 TaxID=1855728 RepID=UPI00097BFD58|nr:cytochrome c [Variovorax sp. KK3]
MSHASKILLSQRWMQWAGIALVAVAPWIAAAADATMADTVRRGAYLANAGDCLACHTSKGGQPFAGGLYMNTPFGQISTPNITPDRKTGIGDWSDDEFYRVMHEGIGRHGEYIYPVMPFPWYTTVTRDDVLAIKAFLMTQPAVEKPRPPIKLAFPFSVRTSLLAWRQVFFEPGTFAPDPAATDEVNRGRYLAEGLAHCGECHNARPVAGTSKWKGSLQGGVIDSWYAPNITPDPRNGIGRWSNSEIANYLKTGIAPGKSVAVGPMSETVHSLSKLSDADLLAIAAYLKATPPAPAKGVDRKLALFQGRDARGGEAYLNFCVSCHGIDGKGMAGTIPALDGNGAVTAKGPQNVINVIVGGLQAREKYAPMPAIGAGMSDQEIADVTNYVRQAWNNSAPATAQAGMVADARRNADTLMSAGGVSGCPKVDTPSLGKAFESQRAAIRTQLAGMTDATMPAQAQRLVAQLRARAPRADNAELINGLAQAYCSAMRDDRKIEANEKSLRLGRFSQLVFMAADGQKLH